MILQSQSHTRFWNALLQFVLNILLGIYHLKGRIGYAGIINVKGTKYMNEWCIMILQLGFLKYSGAVSLLSGCFFFSF